MDNFYKKQKNKGILKPMNKANKYKEIKKNKKNFNYHNHYLIKTSNMIKEDSLSIKFYLT